jgi:hypothetical protein
MAADDVAAGGNEVVAGGIYAVVFDAERIEAAHLKRDLGGDKPHDRGAGSAAGCAIR